MPQSHTYESLRDAYEGLGNAYVETPIFGPAGTCVLYDTAIYHTRLDGDGKQPRRTWHQYYARGGWLKTDTLKFATAGLRASRHSVTANCTLSSQRLRKSSARARAEATAASI